MNQNFNSESSKRLFQKLKQYCRNKAAELKLPTYCICEFKYLEEVVKKLPNNITELSKIKGFGRTRIKKYGQDIVNIVKEHLNENRSSIIDKLDKDDLIEYEKKISKKLQRQELYKEPLNKIRSYILEKKTWIEVQDIEKFLGLKKREPIIKGNNSSTVAHLINNYLKKEGFKTKKIQYENDYSIYVIFKDFYNENDNFEAKQDSKNNTIDAEIILKCIQKYDNKFSYKGIINILTGHYSFSFIPGMKKSEFYGIYKGISINEITKTLDYLINCNIIVNDYKIYIKKDNDTNLNRIEHEKLLQKTFGHNTFKDWQWDIIKKLINKNRILSIEQTGGGKSLCFQYTSQYLHSKNKGVTIVFSPLQALMREQVQYLKSLGIKAECIISEKAVPTKEEEFEHKQIYENLTKNNISILYIAPERLSNQMWLEYVQKFKIAFVVIDEAHCISTWGHDFRSDYRRILTLVKLLPLSIPILALTATANNIVATDIQYQLGGNLQILRGSLDRKNLHLSVIETNNQKEKFIYTKNFIETQTGQGIIYAGTRANTKIFSDWLEYLGIKSTYYHAGLSDNNRRKLEQALRNGEYKVIVSTNALGMGMDKRNLRFVLHVQMPGSLIEYYQEIGRAGRDNLPSNILLLYNDEDIKLQKHFIRTSKPPKKYYINTLNALRNTSLNLSKLTKQINVREQTMKVILKDLEEQELIKNLGNNTYTYIKDMTENEYKIIELHKNVKYDDLNEMLKYVHLDSCRSKCICDYLNDIQDNKCSHCDNCTTPINLHINSYDYNILNEFFANYFIYEQRPNCIAVSSGYYKLDRIGELIKNSKYRNWGYFDNQLLERVLRAYHKYYKAKNFDAILFVPPTKSGDLVENFAQRIADRTNIPLKTDLIKIKEQEMPLKSANNKSQKEQLVKGIFKLNNPQNYINKKILLIDDIIDSGATIDEIAYLLKQHKVSETCVLTIAKTNVGDE